MKSDESSFTEDTIRPYIFKLNPLLQKLGEDVKKYSSFISLLSSDCTIAFSDETVQSLAIDLAVKVCADLDNLCAIPPGDLVHYLQDTLINVRNEFYLAKEYLKKAMYEANKDYLDLSEYHLSLSISHMAHFNTLLNKVIKILNEEY